MAKMRRRKSKRTETLSCNVTISSIRSRVSLSMRDATGADPEVDSRCGLELRGTMSPPIREVREVNSTSGLTRIIGLALREAAGSPGEARLDRVLAGVRDMTVRDAASTLGVSRSPRIVGSRHHVS